MGLSEKSVKLGTSKEITWLQILMAGGHSLSSAGVLARASGCVTKGTCCMQKGPDILL